MAISWDWLLISKAILLAATLQGMRRLTFLNLGSCRLQSQHAAALASALQPLIQLQHLHQRADNLREAGLLALVPTLAAMPGLQTLNIGFNTEEGAAGAQAMCALLVAVPGLTYWTSATTGCRRMPPCWRQRCGA